MDIGSPPVSVKGTVKFWNPENGVAALTLQQHFLAISAMAFSPDGQSLAAASEIRPSLSPLPQMGSCRWCCAGTSLPSLRWPGVRLATAWFRAVWMGRSRFGTPPAARKAITLAGTGEVTAVAWSPDGSRVACGGSDYKVVIYDATPGYKAALTPSYLAVLDQTDRLQSQRCDETGERRPIFTPS